VIGSLPFTTSVDTSSATGALTDPLLFCNESTIDRASRNVWFSFTAGATPVFLDVQTTGSSFDTVLAVHKGTCASPVTIDCSDDFPNAGTASRSFIAVDPGETVLIEAGVPPGSGSSGGTLELEVRHAAAGQPTKGEPEFVVNTYTPYVQGFYGYRRGIDVCGDGTGRFVVAWEDQTLDGDGDGIFARRFDDSGPLGDQFQVNADSLGSQVYPSVACGDAGEFVVAWHDASEGAEARRFDGSGAAVTGDVAVSASIEGAPSAAMAASGDFTVVFQDGGYVKARQFDASGAALGPEFQVSTETGAYPHASGNAAGEVVAVWHGGQVGYEEVVKGRRIESDGTLGAESTLAADENIDYTWPRASMNASGEFIVVWGSNFYERTRARRFDAADDPIDDVIEVASGVPFSLAREGLLADDESFVVVWDTAGNASIHARRFDAAGSGIGDGEFHVEAVGVYPQYGAEVAPLSGNDFVIVWSGFDGYGDGCGYGFCGAEGVRAQRFRVASAPPAPAGCLPAPAASCRVSTVPKKTKLQLVDDADDVYDLVRWTWTKGEATDAADFGDPTTDTSFALCLYDATDTLLYGSSIEAGGTCGTKPCWKALGTPPGSAGFKFKSKTRTPHGIANLVLKPGIDGKATVVAKGGHELLFDGPAGAPELPLALPATVQLQGNNGNCWEAVYDEAGVVVNEAGTFKGKGG
ncbi:MAG TPA: hypothetical protein VNN07_01035, partial [Candidatus Tectomicrobia bacterium]|nr:hypothetical protein [Candidatus Tectomicrobia bacterium]